MKTGCCTMKLEGEEGWVTRVMRWVDGVCICFHVLRTESRDELHRMSL
jgi:hypothetical protein